MRLISFGAIAGIEKTALQNAQYKRMWLAASATGWIRHVGFTANRQTLILPAQRVSLSTLAGNTTWSIISVNGGVILGHQRGGFAGLGARFGPVTWQTSLYRAGNSETLTLCIAKIESAFEMNEIRASSDMLQG